MRNEDLKTQMPRKILITNKDYDGVSGVNHADDGDDGYGGSDDDKRVSFFLWTDCWRNERIDLMDGQCEMLTISCTIKIFIREYVRRKEAAMYPAFFCQKKIRKKL